MKQLLFLFVFLPTLAHSQDNAWNLDEARERLGEGRLIHLTEASANVERPQVHQVLVHSSLDQFDKKTGRRIFRFINGEYFEVVGALCESGSLLPDNIFPGYLSVYCTTKSALVTAPLVPDGH